MRCRSLAEFGIGQMSFRDIRLRHDGNTSIEISFGEFSIMMWQPKVIEVSLQKPIGKVNLSSSKKSLLLDFCEYIFLATLLSVAFCLSSRCFQSVVWYCVFLWWTVTCLPFKIRRLQPLRFVSNLLRLLVLLASS
jgi:hypothetical protein